MKLTKKQETKLTELCFAEKSNKEIAEELKIELKDVHAARSRLGITIPKVKALKEKDVQAVADPRGHLTKARTTPQPFVQNDPRDSNRTEKEIREEIVKVENAHMIAVKKIERCEKRLGELYKELLEVQQCQQ